MDGLEWGPPIYASVDQAWAISARSELVSSKFEMVSTTCGATSTGVGRRRVEADAKFDTDLGHARRQVWLSLLFSREMVLAPSATQANVSGGKPAAPRQTGCTMHGPQR